MNILLFGSIWLVVATFPPNVGARQIIKLKVDLVQTSCGFAVPEMEFKGERTILENWAEKKGKEGIEAYWKEKNVKSIDGFETNILAEWFSMIKADMV